MEEWVGAHWDRLITRLASREHEDQGVALADMARPLALFYRALGGDAALRIVPSGLSRAGGARGWLQRLAGSGLRVTRAELDGQTLALPPRIAVFDTRELNRELYLWLAALAASHGDAPTPADPGWLQANQHACARALARFPGLLPRWQRLRDAHLAQRGAPANAAEAAVQQALRGDAPPPGLHLDPADVAPVWLWISVLPEADPAAPDAQAPAPRSGAGQDRPPDPHASSATRRRTRQVQQKTARAPLLLTSKVESLLSWGEHVQLDRAEDDSPDEQAGEAADDMERLSLVRRVRSLASRVRFDLDLPSAAADDRPLGAPLPLPEWDWKAGRLLPGHCAAQWLQAQPAEPWLPPPALRRVAGRMRRRLEALRAAPQWQHGCAEGERLDLDAWVRHSLARGQPNQSAEPPVHARRQRGQRDLASLLLADLSLSTDAWCSQEARVIDVIRDALYVFGEALQGCGDPFEMLGFSSVRREHVRLQQLKDFDQRWDAAARARVGAVRPGYYTRMGAAVRAATQRLAARPERQRLLLILTDGKPNDLDVYEGRWGLEDTRHAVQQAREAGLTPFCLSIDAEAQDYLPRLFGRGGWAQLQRPEQLPQRLTALYARLTRQA